MHPRTPCQRFTRGFIAICMTAATLVLGIQPALAQTHPVANNHASQFQLTLETIPARVENGRLILGSANLGLTFPQVTRPLSIAAQLADRPQLLASTYLGGSTWDSAYAVAVDSASLISPVRLGRVLFLRVWSATSTRRKRRGCADAASALWMAVPVRCPIPRPTRRGIRNPGGKSPDAVFRSCALSPCFRWRRARWSRWRKGRFPSMSEPSGASSGRC